MVTEFIDHAAEARALIEHEHKPSSMGWETADAQHLANLIEAQANATLALAEQQRISNLIALARIEVENKLTPTDALDTLYSREESAFDVKLHTRPKVARLLGIGGEGDE